MEGEDCRLAPDNSPMLGWASSSLSLLDPGHTSLETCVLKNPPRPLFTGWPNRIRARGHLLPMAVIRYSPVGFVGDTEACELRRRVGQEGISHHRNSCEARASRRLGSGRPRVCCPSCCRHHSRDVSAYPGNHRFGKTVSVGQRHRDPVLTFLQSLDSLFYAYRGGSQ